MEIMRQRGLMAERARLADLLRGQDDAAIDDFLGSIRDRLA